MMTFLLSAGAMIIVLLLIICIPLLTFRKKDTGAEELPQANIAIYRDQFKELEDELARRTDQSKSRRLHGFCLGSGCSFLCRGYVGCYTASR